VFISTYLKQEVQCDLQNLYLEEVFAVPGSAVRCIILVPR
jgi:hypothetical protein